MKPNRIANILRNIAAKIDASKNPSRVLVANDLKKVISKLSAYNPVEYPGLKIIKPNLDTEIKEALEVSDLNKVSLKFLRFIESIGMTPVSGIIDEEMHFIVEPGSVRKLKDACRAATHESPEDDLDVALSCMADAEFMEGAIHYENDKDSQGVFILP